MYGNRIHITGIVQGVGFRPFVFKQAQQNRLTGWVCNTSAGVDIEVFGRLDEINLFVQALKSNPPPLARMDTIETLEIPVEGYPSFTIRDSQAVADAFQPFSPDISICPA